LRNQGSTEKGCKHCMTKIVWTNGCFDILHIGHVELFKYAKSLGDVLIVGIDSDEKVAKDKGPERPFNTVMDRMKILRAIKYVDDVFIFDTTQELADTIKKLSPDVMVIGSDWKGKKVIGEEYTKELRFFDRIAGYSTTDILENRK